MKNPPIDLQNVDKAATQIQRLLTANNAGVPFIVLDCQTCSASLCAEFYLKVDKKFVKERIEESHDLSDFSCLRCRRLCSCSICRKNLVETEPHTQYFTPMAVPQKKGERTYEDQLEFLREKKREAGK